MMAVDVAKDLKIFQPGRIGKVETKNRFIRSATSESMADERGVVSDEYVAFHTRLARGGVGLIFTGHCYVEKAGRNDPRMTGLDSDAAARSLGRATDAVHAVGVPIFAELNHAGSQSVLGTVDAIAPSAIPNPKTHRMPREVQESEITFLVKAFAAAAARAKDAGFDGVHIHAAHGYLLSEFLSPHTNRRNDKWGGQLENRQRLLLQVIGAIRSEVGSDFPITVKLGIRDFVAGGLTLAEGLATAKAVDRAGVQAIEPSAGLMSPALESAVQFAGVSRQRAIADKLVWRALARPIPEAYFRNDAAAVKAAVSCPVIAVGGLRSVEKMESLLTGASADFISLARPLIREPELINALRTDHGRIPKCTSCNICIQHDGFHSLRCWRQSNRDLFVHAYFRFTGKLHK